MVPIIPSPHSRPAWISSLRTLAVAVLGLAVVEARAWSAAGTVSGNTGPLAGVEVSVKDSSQIAPIATDASGRFSLVSQPLSVPDLPANAFSLQGIGRDLVVRFSGEGELEITLLDLSGSTLWKVHTPLVGGEARATIPAVSSVTGGILRIRHGVRILSRVVVLRGAEGWRLAPDPVLARALAGFPTLVFRKEGYRDTAIAMTSASMPDLEVKMNPVSGPIDDFVEDHRSECTIPTLPSVSSLTNHAALPDPFKSLDGSGITTKEQWKCHREVVAAMLEKYVHGEKPRHPEKVTGSFSGNKLTVSVTDKGKTIKFDVTITKPSTGSPPYAALIGWDGGNIGGYSNLPVAKISYSIGQIASEGSGRGKGLFYDLYGSNHSASELMAHAWGLSRIIDALMVTPAAGIDPRRIAVTGCSRWGKSSVVAGSFDRRVKLVIPQESGSGGVASWRIIPTFSDAQPIKSTYDEQYWTRQDFWQNFGNSIGKLPVDHHQMIGMIAPNGLLVLDNSIAWLGPQAGYGSAMAAKEIFTALGAGESITYSSVGGHTHCSMPSSQDHWVKSYMQKFLLDGTGETAKMEAPSDYRFDRAKWIDWTTPTLK